MYNYIEKLPSGYKTYITNEVEFNISGLFIFSELIIELIDIVKAKLSIDLPIKTIYGCPQLRWNGGRLILNTYNNSYANYEKEFEMLSQRRIAPALTFSNHLITKDDLADKDCNLMLELLNCYTGKVIVASDLLYEYIKQNFPKVEIQASVVKVAIDEGKGDFEYYRTLQKRFSRYVIHPDDNFDLELLDLLDRDKVEILLNERCYYNCYHRKEHYCAIAEEQLSQISGTFINKNFLTRCYAIPEVKQSASKERSISLTLSEYKRLQEMGFKLYKIQGRTDNLYVFFFDVLRYMLDNDLSFPLIYPIMCDHINKFINRSKNA